MKGSSIKIKIFGPLALFIMPNSAVSMTKMGQQRTKKGTTNKKTTILKN
jgi:hypothetical protein